jgi:hypothetical protein
VKERAIDFLADRPESDSRLEPGLGEHAQDDLLELLATPSLLRTRGPRVQAVGLLEEAALPWRYGDYADLSATSLFLASDFFTMVGTIRRSA